MNCLNIDIKNDPGVLPQPCPQDPSDPCLCRAGLCSGETHSLRNSTFKTLTPAPRHSSANLTSNKLSLSSEIVNKTGKVYILLDVVRIHVSKCMLSPETCCHRKEA